MTPSSLKPIDEYRQVHAQYESFSERLESLLIDLLASKSIRRHFSESRAKTPESLTEKLGRPGKNYGDDFKTVPDLAGIRVVLYYDDDVSKAAKIVRDEFEIIEEEGGHQPDGYSPDQFGYLSLHFVVALSSRRAELPEWKTYAGMNAEIQIRTVLQHSWAAVSHALQYKREGDVPRALRRRLFRLASLFEIADQEFVGIRDAAEELRVESKKALRGDKSLVSIDAPSINDFIATSKDVARVVSALGKLGFVFNNKTVSVGYLVEEADRLGLSKMSDIEELVKNFDLDYFKRLSAKRPKWVMSKGFMILLSLINRYSKKFSVNHLVSAGKWGRETASLVMSQAGKE
jgi:putative GTP pyrophosphokinase